MIVFEGCKGGEGLMINSFTLIIVPESVVNTIYDTELIPVRQSNIKNRLVTLICKYLKSYLRVLSDFFPKTLLQILYRI